MPSDALARKSLVRLQVLCDATRRCGSWIDDRFLLEYESILKDFQQAGIDVAGFEIPDIAAPTSDGERGCKADFFDMRLKGLILYLSQVAPGAAPNQQVYERLRAAFDGVEDEDPPF